MGKEPDKLIIIDDSSEWISVPYQLNKGSRIKSWYYNTKQDALYLFKISKQKKADGEFFYPEFWSEIIAYHLSLGAPVTVPKAELAYIEQDQQYGVLLTSFISLRNNSLVEGEQIIQLFLKENEELGKNFCLSKMIEILPLLEKLFVKENDGNTFLKTFIDMTFFDTLIGNTDRHWDNWGLIFDNTSKKVAFAPIYDNGSSLGRELEEDRLDTILENRTKWEKYLNTPKPLLYYDLNEYQNAPQRLSYFDFIHRILANNLPYSTYWKDFLLELDDKKILKIMQNLVCDTVFNSKYSLTEKRAHFISKVLIARRNKLLDIFIHYE